MVTLRRGPGCLGTEHSRWREEQVPGPWGRSKLGSGPIEPARGSPGCGAPPSGDLVLPCMMKGSLTQARWPLEVSGVGEEAEVPRPPQLDTL